MVAPVPAGRSGPRVCSAWVRVRVRVSVRVRVQVIVLMSRTGMVRTSLIPKHSVFCFDIFMQMFYAEVGW